MNANREDNTGNVRSLRAGYLEKRPLVFSVAREDHAGVQ